MPIVSRRRSLTLTVVALLFLVITVTVSAVVYPFTGPVFGLAVAPDESLLVADAGAGIFEIRKGQLDQVATLPG